MRWTPLILAGVLAGGLGACDASRKQKKPAATVEKRVDYKLDSESARMAYRRLVSDCLDGRWLDRWFMTSEGREPQILVGRVVNASDEYVDTRLFTKRIEEQLIDMGTVRMLADPQRNQDLSTVDNSDVKSSVEELLERGRELGADYVMLGWVGAHKALEADNEVVRGYQISLDLIATETNEKVWTKTDELQIRPRSR